jgi:predicted amidohydrolase YtcJ
MGYVASDDYWGSQIPRLVNYGLHKRLTVRSVKLFADGALGSWGAALIAPYHDKPDTQGLLRASSQTLQKLVERFHEDDFQVVGRRFVHILFFISRTNTSIAQNIHAIGDRANEVVLDVFEDVLRKPGADVNTWRPRIEHAQIFQPSDFERIGRLGGDLHLSGIPGFDQLDHYL